MSLPARAAAPAPPEDPYCISLLEKQTVKKSGVFKSPARVFEASFAEFEKKFTHFEQAKPSREIPAAFKVKPSLLATESGKAPLSAVRIVMGAGFTYDLLSEYLVAMQEMPTLKLMVLCENSEIRRVREILAQASKKVRDRVSVIKEKSVSGRGMWAQDGSKPIVASQPTSLVTKFRSVERQDLFEALKSFQTAGLVKLRKAAFRFEGGNVIVGERHIFTGVSTAFAMMDLYKISHSDALKVMESQWGKPVFEIGAMHGTDPMQIDYHIDLTMTVVYSPAKDREVVLLGSAQDLLNRVSGMKKDDFKTPTEQNFFGALSDEHNTSKVAMREAMLPLLERDLQALGYETLRVPYWGRGDTPIINYNNVILSDGNVIFPDNGFPILDQAAMKIYSDLGYKPIPFMAAQAAYQSMGGLRCLTEAYRLK